VRTKVYITYARRLLAIAGGCAVVVSLNSCGPSRQQKELAERVVARVEVPRRTVKLAQVQKVCHEMSQHRLPYVFGGESFVEGGMDCSGSVHHVLSRVGYRYVPRQCNHQYYWLVKTGQFNKASKLDEKTLRKMRPGDLMFWKGTYNTGKRWPDVSHVMVYMGRDPSTGKHWMFGGRGTSKRGINGGGVDFFSFTPRESEGRKASFIGYGSVPGVRG